MPLFYFSQYNPHLLIWASIMISLRCWVWLRSIRISNIWIAFSCYLNFEIGRFEGELSKLIFGHFNLSMQIAVAEGFWWMLIFGWLSEGGEHFYSTYSSEMYSLIPDQ